MAAVPLPAAASDFMAAGVLLYLLPGLLAACVLLGLSFLLPATRPWKVATALVFVPALAYFGLVSLSLFPRHAALGAACLVPFLLAVFVCVKSLKRKPASSNTA